MIDRMAKKCKICKQDLHPVRAKYGYDTCVNHSNADRYSGIISGTGEDSFELNIIKDREAAAYLKSLSHVYE